MRHGLKAKEEDGIRELVIEHDKDDEYLCSVYEVSPAVIKKFAAEVREEIIDDEAVARADEKARLDEIAAIVDEILTAKAKRGEIRITAAKKERAEKHANAKPALDKTAKAAEKKAKSDQKTSARASSETARIPKKAAVKKTTVA